MGGGWSQRPLRSQISPLTKEDEEKSQPKNKENQIVIIEKQKLTNELHLAAKIGDIASVLLHLLSGLDPFDLDEYDNIPIYYSSLYGHSLCCAVMLIKMGGHEKLSESDRDHCSTNALTLEIKRLFTGDTHPRLILQQQFPPRSSLAAPLQKSQDPEVEDGEETMFGNLFEQ
jgi:ankyrin repeat protein